MSLNILITGGAGFIGTNMAEKFLPLAKKIFILDNFSRPTSKLNASFLTKLSPKIKIFEASVLEEKLVKKLVIQADVVIHLAAQVAVTTSIIDPQADFDCNVRGSFMILEAVRKYNPEAIVLYSSTNKVYGDLANLKFNPKFGINETAPIDLYSPYGCSKGAADLYFLDYARTFNLKTVVFRQSCIYGSHQYGLEDQGWLAFFVLQFLRQKPITIYGDGQQIRDMLAVEDLTQLYQAAVLNISKVKGQVFNIGGGVTNSTSISQALIEIEKIVGHKTKILKAVKRLGDQDYFVADTRKVKKLLDWQPQINYKIGLKNLVNWCQSAVVKV